MQLIYCVCCVYPLLGTTFPENDRIPTQSLTTRSSLVTDGLYVSHYTRRILLLKLQRQVDYITIMIKNYYYITTITTTVLKHCIRRLLRYNT